MNSYFFFIIMNIFFSNLPVSLSVDDPRYIDCARTSVCGDIKSITYPFWGIDRAEHCGHPDFKLKCQNDLLEIEIQSQNYRVISMNTSDRILRIATMSYCTSLSISGDYHLFYYYTPTTQSLTLFNNCPLVQGLNTTDKFNCSINANATNNYFWIDYTPETAPFPNLIQCQVKITVPVLRHLVNLTLHGFNKSSLSLDEVLRMGFDVEYVMDVSECKSCKSSGGECGYDVKAGQPTCFCRDSRQYQGRCSTQPRNVKVIVSIGTSVGGTLIIVAVGIIIFCRLRKKKMKNSENLEAFLRTHGALALRRYKYSDVRKMTGSFQDKLGQGGFGSVYKGKLLDGRMVAVKVLNEAKGNGNEFINEVASISRTSHVNVVALLGFCVEGPKRALIYEYVPNGSLEKFIYAENPLKADFHLGWETLYKIAIGIAHGLEYLHRGCYIHILHFDIKPHNILLDEDFNPKISDFGLAKLCFGKDSIVSMTGARGTAGYIAPELVSRNFGGISHKADVYSYGMMVLEMVGGRKNLNIRVSNLSEIYFPQWIYKRLDLKEDLGLYGVTTEEAEEIARKLILVGLWCIQMDPSDRPAMSKVLGMLEGSLQALHIPPKPFISSSAKEEGSSSMTSIS